MDKPVARTFIAHVEDRPGVLNRVISLFRRRGYNIESLTVARTEQPQVSRVTLVVEADDDTARRLEANLYKLINVLYVEDVTLAAPVARELALIKLRVDVDSRPKLLQLCEVFRARPVDVTPTSVILEATGTLSKIDRLIELLKDYGIVELARTGAVALTRGEESALARVTGRGGDDDDQIAA